MGFLEKGTWNSSCTNDFYSLGQEVIKLDFSSLTSCPTKNRYILYTSLATPLAHTSILVRTAKRLEDFIGVCIVSASKDINGWEFKKNAVGTTDRYNACAYLYELYQKSDSSYSGDASLPLIWDMQEERILTNCPLDILVFLDSYFDPLLEDELSLYPEDKKKKINYFWQFILEDLYEPIFKVSSCQNQKEYELYSGKVFGALDELESLLKHQQTLLGVDLTIVDWFLFSILIRFDVVYFSLFMLNKKSLSSYKYLSDYMTFLYQEEHIGCTANIDHIKEHYYKSYPSLNPRKIIPCGPKVNFDYIYNRFRLF